MNGLVIHLYQDDVDFSAYLILSEYKVRSKLMLVIMLQITLNVLNGL